MLRDDDAETINKTVDYLADYNYHLQHNTRLHINELREKTRLKIVSLENNQKLQDLFLTVYHCFVVYASSSPCCKVIMNNKGKSYSVNHK